MKRRILPDRRATTTFDLVYQFMIFQLGYSRFDADPDRPGEGGGTIAEVFVSGPKSGEQLHALVRDAAILVSLALQHGADLNVLRGSMSRGDDASPHSVIGAVLDALAQEDQAS